MAQSRERLSGIIVKGLNADDVKFLGEMVKEGKIEALKTKENVLIGKELAKQLGLFVGDRLTLMVPLGGYSPMGAMPETVRARVGGIFDTGMYEIDNTLVIMPLSDVEGIMGIGAMGLEIKLTDV